MNTPIVPLPEFGEHWSGGRWHICRRADGKSLCAKWRTRSKHLGRVTADHCKPYSNECKDCARQLASVLSTNQPKKRKGGAE